MEGAPLAISLGDPAGVGPELIAAAWAARDSQELLPFVVTGLHNRIDLASLVPGGHCGEFRVSAASTLSSSVSGCS